MKINIPPAALEAAAKGAWDAERARLSEYTLPPWEDLHHEVKKQKIDHARATFEAMVENWDGAFKNRSGDYVMLRLSDAIILPMLMENPDAEA